MTATVVENQLELRGIHTPLLSVGDAHANEAVVFVHGNPGSGHDWLGLMNAVGAHARAVAWDAPGFGRADKPIEFDYTVGGYARFVGDVLDTIRVARAHLVLHDFGGAWGLQWAAEHPDRVGSLTLINTGVLVDYSWHLMAKIWRTPILGELVMATATRTAFRMMMRIGNPRGLPLEFVDRMYDDFDTPTRKAVLKLYRASPTNMIEALGRPLRAIDPPTLVVWGAQDPYIPRTQAELQKQTFPRAEVHLLHDSGHWPFVDNPDRVRELVVPFLQRVVGG